MTPFIRRSLLSAIALFLAHTTRAAAEQQTYPQIVSCSLERPIIANNEDKELVFHAQSSQNPTSSNGSNPWKLFSGGMRALTWLPIDNQRSELEQPPNDVMDGSMSNSGYTVSIGGKAIMEESEQVGDSSTSNTLDIGVDHHIRLSPTIGRPVLAFLFRLDPGTTANHVNTTLALQPFPEKSQVVNSCIHDIGVGGISNQIHYSVNGPVPIDDPGEVGFIKMDTVDINVILTVTVVDSEYNYYSSSYNLNFVESTAVAPTDGSLSFGSDGGSAPTMSPASNNTTEVDDDDDNENIITPSEPLNVKNVPADSTEEDAATMSAASTSTDNTTRTRTIGAATALALVGFGMIAAFVFWSYKKKQHNMAANAVGVAPAASVPVGHDLV